MNNIFKRVARWNEARFAQDYNHDLAVRLVDEEFYEWLTATDAVGKLDGLCDIIFVAMGNVWKLNPTLEEDEAASILANDVATFVIDVCAEPAYFIGVYCMANRLETDNAINNNKIIVQLAIMQLYGMGLDYDQIVKALNIVCDANDTKSVQKLESGVKAGKGEFFKAPEPRLKALLEEVANNE